MPALAAELSVSVEAGEDVAVEGLVPVFCADELFDVPVENVAVAGVGVFVAEVDG